ncbi:MAG: hypothetical protein Unbinned5350contig1004_39 [Prokaryotic dsDNA virus sp.]|nr:MAG: hypothetical protein Unbinned5350contig1004_39 [Prokaryotic dsDNA virus sp.]|tara:strand:- start:267 stop:956 length:690 start_codon:yes stop_codon:yes gene_type:complete
MEITIFKDITTEGVIASIEENSAKYHEGFYADMENLPERTLVKKSASEIGDIIKELKASRIKITKANTAAVNKEHDAIVERLELANKPFTDLIDEYNVKRKKILADGKRVVELRAAMAQKEDDHEMGLLINKTFEFDKSEELRIKKESDDAYKLQADADAEERAKSKAAHAEATRVNKENAQLANKEHVKNINNHALNCLMTCNLTYEQAKSVVVAIAKNEISHVNINY